MTSDKSQPCPACGSEVLAFTEEPCTKVRANRCLSCGLRGPWTHSDSEAIRAWNRLRYVDEHTLVIPVLPADEGAEERVRALVERAIEGRGTKKVVRDAE